ncbi:(2,3-dihydroxybenzoyl)adenylate synthase [Nocardioides sp. DS6]|uniref:(2,3-dihydroxybenzoyl)adenylate synthase n=1 Tax=Nocardioides eburneus TaxID=3231482 RepID=A0ABV3SX75_9ACTN
MTTPTRSTRSRALPYPRHGEAERRRFRELGLWTPESFADFVVDRTRRYAANTAVVGRDCHGAEVRWTYADLGQQAALAARRLASYGVARGDRVVVALPNVVEYLAVVLGLFRMGAVPVFALPTHREIELGQFCTIADAAALVVVGDPDGTDHRGLHKLVSDRVAEQGVEPPVLVDVEEWERGDAGGVAVEVADVAADELAFLQLSGGTTGISKLIPRAAEEYLYSVRASAEICGLDQDTVMLVVLPASHNFPMSSPGILGVLHAGGTVVLAPDPSPRTGFALIAREHVTVTALVPPLAQAWISAARRRRPDLSSLRTVQVGGAKLNDVVARDVEPVLHGRLQQVFGMAEGLVNYTRDDDPDELVLTTQGRPMSAYDEVRVVDPDDPSREVTDGQEGALLTRGPYTIRGYYGGPSWTEAVNASSFTEDGFYRTGDLVRRHPSGHLTVTGRDKDQINRAGEKIATDEIEGHLLARREVLDAVAVGLPDAYLGERICAVVRLEPGAERRPEELAEALRTAGLATYKIPDSFVFLDDFPATHVGKNSRRELRRLLTDQLADQLTD